MRRKDRAVTDEDGIRRILESCSVCRIGLRDGDSVYIVPLNYGYEYENGALTFYFHCAHTGRKLELLQKSPRVGFELDGGHALIEADEACGYAYRFVSIIGTGTATVVDEHTEKARALALLMKHQSGRDFTFTPRETATVTILRVAADSFEAKRHE